MSEAYRLTPVRLALIGAVSLGWAFSFGLGAPLASVWLTKAGHSDTIVGLNTTTYYLGIALAAALVPWMMRRCGRGCVAAGIIGSGFTVACLPLCGPIALWFLCRFLNGVLAAMSLIPLETYVNRQSATEHRARNFGYYALAIALGWALGNLVGLQMATDAPRLAFLLGGLAAVAAGFLLLVAVYWPPEPQPTLEVAPPLPWSQTCLSFGSAWAQGFLEGGMISFLAVYLLFLGLADGQVGWLTSGTMLGAILFQVPLAWLADRWSRPGVLLCCYVATGMGLGFLPGCSNPIYLALWLFIVGACSGAFYPLGLAILGERLPSCSLARANALFLAINCLGSVIGPFVTGAAMDHFGKRAVFVCGEIAVLSVLLVSQVLSRSRRKIATPPNTAVEIHRAA